MQEGKNMTAIGRTSMNVTKNPTYDKFSYMTLCDSCNSKLCCTDFAEPILFPTDLEKLDKIKKSGSDFVQEIMIETKSIKTLRTRTNSNACIFWDTEKKLCSIYENRPFDCRMFPFDIDWVDGQYHWIIYSCNPNSDWSWTEDHIKKLEDDPQFDEVMRNKEFFRLTSKNYVDTSKEPPYAILRKVNWKNGS
jgi:Fe-S-cluster containining protein